MEETYLIINPGSASKKYALYRGASCIASAHFEQEGDIHIQTFTVGETTEKSALAEADFIQGTQLFCALLVAKNVLKSVDEISAIGLRIVAPGDFFAEHHMIDSDFEKRLQDTADQAPLHIAPLLSEIFLIKKEFPKTSLVAVSDSAYHKTMVSEARHYALPKDIADKYGIYRYGYHGISAESVVRKFGQINGSLPGKIILCHLGSGSSITAVKEGSSLDTSMGFTPLEGMMMATRTGDIDPGAVLYLAKRFNLNLDKINEFFNSKSGLLGVSGKSADTRELITLEESGDEDATLALAMVVYRVKKYIGAYAAALNGIDSLIFTGTIGERSYIMRSRICKDLAVLGIHVDEAKNKTATSGDHFIQSDDAKVLVAVVACDEMAEMAREVARQGHRR